MSDGKGQSLLHLPESFHHGLLAAPQYRHSLTPACGDIHQLQGMYVVACRCRSAVVHQVSLEAARYTNVPPQPTHGHFSQQLIRWLRPAPRELRGILLETLQKPLYRGTADRSQFLLYR